MLISHEVPISLLKNSKKFNDYDYCLVHLIDLYPEYKQYYIDAVKKGRQVLLDNSLFELGDSVSSYKLVKGILEIKPTWYVIPDCFNNSTVTMKRFDEFCKQYPDLPGLKIGVVQGDTLKELIKCYKFMSEKADKIAIPFDSVVFNDIVKTHNPLINYCFGRREFIKLLIKEGIWNKEKPHHLLGCSLAREFGFDLYRENIESIDTSNPIVSGLIQLPYNENGLKIKPHIKLCDVVNEKIDRKQLNYIMKNIKIFRNICEEKNYV